jgi:hypothetical protein
MGAIYFSEISVDFTGLYDFTSQKAELYMEDTPFST